MYIYNYIWGHTFYINMLIILHFITHWLDLVVIILEMNKDFLKDPENLNYLLIYLQYLCLIKKSKKPHISRCKTLFPANRSFSNLPNIADYLHVSPYLEKLRVNSKENFPEAMRCHASYICSNRYTSKN